jgi:hypothetical protein
MSPQLEAGPAPYTYVFPASREAVDRLLAASPAALQEV